MPKARQEYECFECKKIIKKGEEYQRQTRYETPNDKTYCNLSHGVQKPICLKCISENKYSYIDEKYNSPDIVKFGIHSGKLWSKVPNDYIIYMYENKKTHKHFSEFEKEYIKRLKRNNTNDISPISEDEALKHIEQLHNNLLDTPKFKKTPQLTDTMRTVYVTLLKNKDKVKRLKHEYNSYYWLLEKSFDVKICRNRKEIDNRTIEALYKRGLLKPTKFKDDIQKRTTEVIEYESIYDNRVMLDRWGGQ